MPVLSLGIYKDLAILLIVSIALGAGLSAVGGDLAHEYFDGTVSGYMGDYGEYDIVLTINDGMQEQAVQGLQDHLKQGLPGAFYMEGPGMAGRVTLFVSLGEEPDKKAYDSFLSYMDRLPGLISFNVIAQPRLSLQGVPQGGASYLKRALEDEEGFRFLLSTAKGLEIFVDSPENVQPLSRAIEEFLLQHRLLKVAAPPGGALELQDMGEEIQEILKKGGWQGARPIQGGLMVDIPFREELQSLQTILLKLIPGYHLPGLHRLEEATLYGWPEGNLHGEPRTLKVHTQEEKGLLLLDMGDEGLPVESLHIYSDEQRQTYLGQAHRAKGWIDQEGFLRLQEVLGELGNTLPELLSLQEKWQEYASRFSQEEGSVFSRQLLTFLTSLVDLQESLGEAQEILVQWQEYLDQAQGAMAFRRLFFPPSSPVEARILELEEDILALKELLQKGESTLYQQQNDMLALEDWLEEGGALQELFGTLSLEIGREDTLQEAQKALEGLPGSPSVPQEAVALLLNLHDLLQEGNQDQELLFMVPGTWREEELQKGLEDFFSPVKPVVEIRDLGILKPDIRGELFQVLGEVQLTITAIFGVMAVFLLLLLDHTTAMSLIGLLRRRRSLPFWARILYSESVYGILVGGITLWAMLFLAGGRLPYLDGVGVLLLGGFFGFLASLLAHRVNPIHASEFAAGEAMGLARDTIIREIVLPGARPGLWALLNRPNQLFR